MPKVGKREFDYDAAGEKAATVYAKKTGKPVKNVKPPMKRGGVKKK